MTPLLSVSPSPFFYLIFGLMMVGSRYIFGPRLHLVMLAHSSSSARNDCAGTGDACSNGDDGGTLVALAGAGSL